MIISIPMSRQTLVPLSSNYLKKEDFPVHQNKLQGKKLTITAGKSISILDLQNELVAGSSGVKQNILNRNKKTRTTISSDSESFVAMSLQSEREPDDDIESATKFTQENTSESNTCKGRNEIKIGQFVLFLYEKHSYPEQVIELKEDEK
ncbi:unnamed protein product [Acanthoscelides obtectus]|uniref:Uncharacterized protein n=1 Tax=Acanthoscelides obtectus TaxID=200917 RepID=A0A9P0L2Z5_ACAOB|nr:unnamed protein product [Acanthoscelides obtectus]CAK1671128.1 hypothetical protein AOBTE_LOCUS28073 [Acanthoscelides obtectus]